MITTVNIRVEQFLFYNMFLLFSAWNGEIFCFSGFFKEWCFKSLQKGIWGTYVCVCIYLNKSSVL